MLILGLVCLSVCGRHIFKDRRAYLLRNLNMYFRIRYFSDMQSNSYPTWIFNVLEYLGQKNIPLTKRLQCSLQDEASNSYRPITLKKTLLYVIKHIA